MPEDDNNDNRLENLLSKLVDETISAEELLILEQQLDGNPEAQSQYLRYLDLHSELVQSGGEFEAPEAITLSKRIPWLPVTLTALAAMIAIAAVVLFQGIDEHRPIVQIIAGGGPVEWEGRNGKIRTAPKSGTFLSAGTIETLAAKSWIEIAFPDGTTSSLSGPSILTVSLVDGRKVLRLKKGNLSVDAARQPEGLPMRVITASAEAEVLGTQFNIQATSSSTQLTVNEGKVRMKRLADGKIEDVTANEELTAALEQGTEFTASRPPVAVHTWKSRIPRDAIQGHPEISDAGVPGIRAEGHIWRGDPKFPTKPTLLYSTVFDPSRHRSPPMQIKEGSQIVIQGRMDRPVRLHTGFATKRDRGGFSGKYAVYHGAPVELDENGQFQIELPLSSFLSTHERFPSSPVDQEMMFLWVQTVKSDAGLVIESVEVKE